MSHYSPAEGGWFVLGLMPPTPWLPGLLAMEPSAVLQLGCVFMDPIAQVEVCGNRGVNHNSEEGTCLLRSWMLTRRASVRV